MINKAMWQKLMDGDAWDLQDFRRNEDGDYVLGNDFYISKRPQGIDYCDAKKEIWIWSIGRHNVTGQILASTTTKFYQNPDYECLWLR